MLLFMKRLTWYRKDALAATCCFSRAAVFTRRRDQPSEPVQAPGLKEGLEEVTGETVYCVSCTKRDLLLSLDLDATREPAQKRTGQAPDQAIFETRDPDRRGL